MVSGSSQQDTLQRRPHCATHHAVEPMVVASLGTLLPFIDGPTTAFRLDPIFSRHVFREKAMLLRAIPKE